jgi:cysteinyl-tRNA synthetase
MFGHGQRTIGRNYRYSCGGSDLIFPHHENEIAQSEAATGKPLAHYWLHNGMVKVAGEKCRNPSVISSLFASYWPNMTP